MNISRRAFVLSSLSMPIWLSAGRASAQVDCTLPSAGTPTQLVPKEDTLLARPTAFSLSTAAFARSLSQFSAAIDVVRKRSDDDVTGWGKQVAQHCINCTFNNPNNIHYNWYFLGWHRALLYLLERNLRQIGPDSIRLPYWDWESSTSRTLPSIYADPNSSLYYANRQTSGPSWPLSDEDVDVQPFFAIGSFDDFGGTATRADPTPVTFSGPHANVHNAFAPGDMSDLMYSPRDPIFYAHHANIDRLWASWAAAGNPKPEFGDASVNFFDENKQWRYIKLDDLRDETKLGYRYDSLMKLKAPVSGFARFHFDPAGAHLFNLAALAQLPVKKPGPRPDFLLVRNIDLSRFSKEDVRFGLFTRAPQQGVLSAGDKTYLGRVSRVQSKEHEHSGPISAALDVTGRVRGALGANRRSLSLFIAPLDATGRTSAAGEPLIAKSLSLVR
jgi:Common central domain of tyrosinase/Polyphenol oxidase middle domain